MHPMRCFVMLSLDYGSLMRAKNNNNKAGISKLELPRNQKVFTASTLKANQLIFQCNCAFKRMIVLQCVSSPRPARVAEPASAASTPVLSDSESQLTRQCTLLSRRKKRRVRSTVSGAQRTKTGKCGDFFYL